MTDAYADWQEVPADPHAGWTEAPADAGPRKRTLLDAVAGGLSQVPMGLGDEIGAGMQAMASNLMNARSFKSPDEEQKNFLQTYRQALSENRGELERAKKDHPVAYYGALGGGTLATGSLMPALRAGQGVGLGGRLLTHAANGLLQGGAFGAGNSEADLTRGEVGKFGKDVAKYAAGGAGLGVGGGLVGEGLGAASQGLGKVATNAEAKAADMAAKAAEAETAAARGSLGAQVQQANRLVENLQRLKATGSASPEQLAKLEQLKPVLGELERKLMDSSLKALPSMGEDVEGARAALQDVAANQPERTAALTEEALSPKTAWNQLTARVKRYALPLAGAAIGHHFGGAIGMGAGGLAGRAMSPTVQALLRMVKHPAIASRLAGAGERALGGLAPGAATVGERLGPAMERELFPSFLAESPTAGWAEVPADDPQAQLAAALRRNP